MAYCSECLVSEVGPGLGEYQHEGDLVAAVACLSWAVQRNYPLGFAGLEPSCFGIEDGKLRNWATAVVVMRLERHWHCAWMGCKLRIRCCSELALCRSSSRDAKESEELVLGVRRRSWIGVPGLNVPSGIVLYLDDRCPHFVRDFACRTRCREGLVGPLQDLAGLVAEIICYRGENGDFEGR